MLKARLCKPIGNLAHANNSNSVIYLVFELFLLMFHRFRAYEKSECITIIRKSHYA